ncbi:nitrogen regulatory IIA protein [Flavobacterium sp. Fl-77]|uniref:Nitrogen regulatory IIA protein n=1 Tax=Flavobacterium flavipigmentatum TaxID=2893884 RepID=A0AAJ2SFU7_9FLAO|nr:MULTISPECIES: nitrogen regulatory IIA protein [unclassified Flavobacterium]MDX6182386.1 nitrogen regulatory IIA protein [Flavobacterium sp. Fl-33]MDX6185701.1 nitrogen regulatory IIA protein [Flavobacterium sp. Fl-77]UFH38885.1 nitrogen regulatory IIA protein [Flavobacterium sp. F-70]
MKKVRTNISEWFDKQDQRWRALTIAKQHQYTLYFFAGYLLLTIGVIFKVGFDIARSDNDIVIEPIKNPGLKKKESPTALQDSLITILKNKIYEGK